MQIYKITNENYNHEYQPTEIERWLEHGRNLGATFAILYIDRYEGQQAMSYVFPGNDPHSVIRRLEQEHQTRITQYWEYL